MFQALLPVFVTIIVTSIIILIRNKIYKRTKDPLLLLVIDGISVIGVVLTAAIIHFENGRTIFCTCGTIKIWVGNIWSSENSQQLLDPYTFTHIFHGVIFYGLLHILVPKLSVRQRLIFAVAIESSWEVFENT